MANAFQTTAFQHPGFQGGGVAPPVARYPAGGVAKKHRRTLVEIDGQTHSVRNPEEAQALLVQARIDADANATRAAKTALNRARDQQRKTGKLPTLEVAVPAIRVIGRPDPEIRDLVIAAQQGVDEIYLRAAQAVELAWLARRAWYEQDEEDVAILLLH